MNIWQKKGRGRRNNKLLSITRLPFGQHLLWLLSVKLGVATFSADGRRKGEAIRKTNINPGTWLLRRCKFKLDRSREFRVAACFNRIHHGCGLTLGADLNFRIIHRRPIKVYLPTFFFLSLNKFMVIPRVSVGTIC